MLIVCPSCATTYSLTEAQMGRGRTLRCANCRHTWHASAPQDGSEPVQPQLAFAEAGAPQPGLALADAAATAQPSAEPEVPPPAKVVRGRHRPSRGKSRPSGARVSDLAGRIRSVKPWQWALAGAIGALFAAVMAREPLVRTLPQTARLFAAAGLPVNLRGLALDGARSEILVDKDQTTLVVEGTIRNLRKTDTAVPALTLSLRGPDGGEIYAWTAEAPRGVLASGESTPFRTHVVAPPLDGRDVLVRFARHEDGAPAVH